MATHHDEHASENGDPAEHGEEISPSFTTLLLPFGLLIGVTFSTPTPAYNTYQAVGHSATDSLLTGRAGTEPAPVFPSLAIVVQWVRRGRASNAWDSA
jgi:hypothetical protein